MEINLLSFPAFLQPISSVPFHGSPFRKPLRTSLPFRSVANRHGHIIKAVVAKPPAPSGKPQKLSKVEGIKTESNQLRFPLTEELANSEAFITQDAVQVMKFHGSYQQTNREIRKQKSYQFMLRLKMPAGEFPAPLYLVLDDIASKHGNQTIRATTRCAWQVHGILKSDLKNVFSAIMNNGGSCVGACGDLSRNVMCTPAPIVSNLYNHARYISKMIGELFAPQSGAFSEIWLDGEKAASLEFWKKDIDMNKVGQLMRFDNGNGVVFPGKEEPIYGETYLPRKFKIGVTVPGDNSIDIYTQDIGIVCLPDENGEVIGYNVIVGGGMGRTHRKEETFPRVGDHLGYVSRDKLWEALKAIVAAQRDHGNRSVRMNARMKYLVDRLGIDSFRTLVESYYGDKFESFRTMPEWSYKDWLGWHDQGDGNLFLGLFIEHGRIKDDGDFKLRTALRRIVEAYAYEMVITPNQNVVLKNILPEQKDGIEAILREHHVKLADDYTMNQRLSMACPALPLCGLATTEAERVMPSIVDRVSAVFNKFGVDIPVTMRMTGCPNGCARPYMAELGFVGSGAKMYQLWLGGSPNQTRLAWTFLEKMKEEKLEETLGPIVDMYTKQSMSGEAFGDFCDRVGKLAIEKFSENAEEEEREVRVTRLPARREGPPKITVVSATGTQAKTDEKPVKTEEKVETKSASKAAAASKDGATSEKTISESSVNGNGAARKRRAKPRLTVGDEIMERLKNIAALRDMSASMVADEIITAYLSGVEDEDLMDPTDLL